MNMKKNNKGNSKPSIISWDPAEQHLFAMIVSKIRGQVTQEVVIDKNELEKIPEYSDSCKAEFENMMAKLLKGVDDLTVIQKDENGQSNMFRMFDDFIFRYPDELDKMVVKVKPSSYYTYFVNALNINLTEFELSEYLTLRSTYSLTCYLQLKQWKNMGHHVFSINEFRELFEIPKSSDAFEIEQQVLLPIRNELGEFLKKLNITTTKRDNKIVEYSFTWKPENIDTPKDESKEDDLEKYVAKSWSYKPILKNYSELSYQGVLMEKFKNPDPKDTDGNQEEKKKEIAAQKKILEKLSDIWVDGRTGRQLTEGELKAYVDQKGNYPYYVLPFCP